MRSAPESPVHNGAGLGAGDGCIRAEKPALIALDEADLSRSCDAFRIPGPGRDVKEGVLAVQPLQLEEADGDFANSALVMLALGRKEPSS